MIDPFVALMRRYCIDYTNSHDLSVCDSIMEPDYVVHISGMTLVRDESYKPAVETVFGRFPGLELEVHDLVTNGSRLAMRFSEHGATPDGALATWAGISLYEWNGSRLLSCRVEQDFWSQQRQLQTGSPDAVEAPHLDPWTTTEPVPADAAAEDAARAWLERGRLAELPGGRVDENAPTDHKPAIDTKDVEIFDLFSAGNRVAFHASFRGPYIGGLDHDTHVGHPLALAVAGLLTVSDGTVEHGHAVTDRFGAWMQLATMASG